MASVRLCRYEIVRKGSCRRGDSYYFSHDLSGRSRSSTVSITTSCSSLSSASRSKPAHPHLSSEGGTTKDSSQGQQNSIACIFYRKGACAKGDACAFSHANLTETTSATAKNPDVLHRQKNNHVPDTAKSPGRLVRLINGASVEFDDGVAVKKISLPQDFSTISISGLPLDTTQEDIVKLIRHVYDEIDVEIKITKSRSTSTALVTAEDPFFASNICELLNADVTASIGYARVTVAKISQKVDFGSSTQRINCRTVICSWKKPTKKVVLCYYSGHLAREVRNCFQDGTYRLSGQIIHSEVFVRKPYESDHGLVFRKQYHVHLRNVPDFIDDEDIEAFLDLSEEAPFTSPISESSYDLIGTVGEIESKMSSIGSLEKFSFVEKTLGKSYKAVVTFNNDSDAAEACKVLDGSEIVADVLTLNVHPIYSVKTKFSTKIHDVLQHRLHSIVEGNEDVHLAFFRNSDAAQRLTTAKIIGTDMVEVSKAKVDLDAFLLGSVASLDGRTVWHKSLTFKSYSDEISTIEKQHSVAFIVDATNSSVRVFGSDTACSNATRALASLVKNKCTNSHEINIDDVMFGKLMTDGLEELGQRFGKDEVSVKITPTSKKLLIRSRTENADVRRILAGLSTLSLFDDVENCTICFTPAESAILTSCGHTYCQDCFEGMCVAAVTDQKGCHILCQGNEGHCKHDFSRKELGHYLPSQVFENMFNLSFQKHIRDRPLEFKFCPTKDCGQLYRPASAERPDTVHYCLKCLNGICLQCHACHGRMSCAEWGYIARGEAEAARKVMEQLGVKDCPKCEMHIEKADGCNHMQCESCKTHICWICLKVFEESNDTYSHLNDAHGGIGLHDENGNQLVDEPNEFWEDEQEEV